MRRQFSFYLLAIALWCTAFCPLQAQDSHTSDTDRPFYLPDHLVSQFAGNIGLLSAGIGYSYGKDKWQTDLVYGFVPAFESQTTIHILTAKTAFRPYRIELKGGKYSLTPLRVGTGISYSVGRQFHTTWPGRYPDGYYWFTTSFRFTPFIGAAISAPLNEGRTMFKRLELYSELGTTDLHIISYVPNMKYFKPWSAFNVAFGVKAVF